MEFTSAISLTTKLKPPVEFFIAAQQNDLLTLRAYLSGDYNIDAKMEFGANSITPLETACLEGNVDVVQELLIKGACVNTTINFWKISLLHFSAKKGFYQIVSLLINSKAEVDQVDRSGITPLMLACEKGHIDIVKFLLNSGADVNHQAGYETIPYTARKLIHSPAISEDVLESIKEMYTKNTSLMKAYYAGEAEIAIELLKHGCDTDTKNEKGNTVLHISSREGNLEFVKLLIKCNATVDVQNNSHETSLALALQGFFRTEHVRTAKRFLLISEKLIQAGANVQLKMNNKTILSDIVSTNRGKMSEKMERYRSRLIYLAVSATLHIQTSSIIELNRETYGMQSAYKDLLLWLQSLSNSPMTLQHLVRFCVRRTLPREISQSVESLPIPNSLKAYILFQTRCA